MKKKTAIDYRELLLKYMDHVGMEEGVTFVSSINAWRSPINRVVFSEEEAAELRAIEDELPPS